ILCDESCPLQSASFTSGTSVTLTATPSPVSTFAGWSGACSGTGTCTVSMTQARNVTATFNSNPVPPPTPTIFTATASAVCGSGRIDLSWSASAGATNYKVYRDGGATPIYNASGLSYPDLGLADGSFHTYTITASNANGTSASASASATAPSACSGLSNLTPNNPSSFSATVGTSRTFTFSITNNGSIPTPVGFSNRFQLATGANGAGSISTLSTNGLTSLSDGASADVTSGSKNFSAGECSSDICSVRVQTDSTSVISESNEGDNYSSWININVSAVPSNNPPTVINTTVSSITTTSASLGVNITSDGGAAITSRGTCLSTTNANPVTSNCINEGSTSLGVFNHNRTGLSSNITYFYSGYADNSEGRGYAPSTSFVTAASAGSPTTPPCDTVSWYSAGADIWGYRKVILIDSNDLAKVPSNLTGFPVLISLTDPDLKSVSNGGNVTSANGYDILFTSLNGTTKLAHEIERYNPATGQLIAWVKADLSTAADTKIYMYYGSNAGNQQNIIGVWDANFKGVWHMPDGTTLSALDSTSNNIDGVNSGVTAIAGEADGGANFNSSSDRISFGAGVPAALALSNGTIYLWAKANALGTSQYMVSKDNVGSNTGDGAFYLAAPSNKYTFYLQSGASTYQVWADNATSAGSWNQLAFTFGSGGMRLYVNGILQADQNSHTGGWNNVSAFLFFGAQRVSVSPFGGVLDELQISNAARSAGWIKAEYVNQSNPSNFYGISTQCSLPDLTASAPTQNTATVGTPQAFTSTITNSGGSSTGSAFTNLFQFDDNPDHTTVFANQTVSAGPIAAGAPAGITSSYNFPTSGTWYVRVCADKSSAGDPGTIPESDENNNCSDPWKTVSVSSGVSATADIKANGSNGPITIAAGDPVDITWTSSNATACRVDPPNWTELNAPAGTYTLNLSSSVTYRIYCDPPAAGSQDDEVVVNVTATTRNLVVVKAGQGTVTSSPGGIDCGPGCQASYTPGTIIILTEVPNTARIFTGWSGVVCSEGNQRSETCTFPMPNNDLTIIASFAVDPNYQEF
ncbi:MAG: DUF2341 domain-containing protein, partial [Candidatus Zambryskibacteria bacterium]